MVIKTLQWNIGGGKIRSESADPQLEQSYSLEGLKYITEIINQYKPDIITFQETHSNENLNQAEQIADELNYHYINDPYDQSHLDKDFKLGQAILSKYPIKDHQFEFIDCEKREVIRPDGQNWVMHDKGISTILVDAKKFTIEIKTLHMFPFRKFNIDPFSQSFAKTRNDIINKLQLKEKIGLIQADFNFDDTSLIKLLPELFDDIKEIPQKEFTTPKDRKYDHILYKGMDQIGTNIIKTLTDHYPIVSELSIN